MTLHYWVIWGFGRVWIRQDMINSFTLDTVSVLQLLVIFASALLICSLSLSTLSLRADRCTAEAAMRMAFVFLRGLHY